MLMRSCIIWLVAIMQSNQEKNREWEGWMFVFDWVYSWEDCFYVNLRNTFFIMCVQYCWYTGAQVHSYPPSFCEPFLHRFPSFWAIFLRFFDRCAEIVSIFVGFVCRKWFLIEEHIWLVQSLDEFLLCSIIVVLACDLAGDFQNLKMYQIN